MQKTAAPDSTFKLVAAKTRFIHNLFHKEVSVKNLFFISKVPRYFLWSNKLLCELIDYEFSMKYFYLNWYFVTEKNLHFIFDCRFGPKLCKNLFCMKSYSSSKICIQTFNKSARIEIKMFSLIWLFLLCYDQLQSY